VSSERPRLAGDEQARPDVLGVAWLAGRRAGATGDRRAAALGRCAEQQAAAAAWETLATARVAVSRRGCACDGEGNGPTGEKKRRPKRYFHLHNQWQVGNFQEQKQVKAGPPPAFENELRKSCFWLWLWLAANPFG